MSDVYFKASLQNTLNPEVGTFDNVNNKEGAFTLEDGEYYLTNNTNNAYRVYYPTKDIYSVGFTIEFDINYNSNSGFKWLLLFNGNESTYWHGFSLESSILRYVGNGLSDHDLITSPNIWLHIKCIFDYYNSQNTVRIYIDNVEVNTFTISKNYGIKYIDILGNSGGYVSDAKIKNIIIYNSSKKHYLDTIGLTTLWSKIKSLFATKTELGSKANDSDVVHKSGDETISGTKTFSSNIVGNITGKSREILTENGSHIIQNDNGSFYAYDNKRKAFVWNSTEGHAYFYGVADKAMQDSDGNPINTTYLPLAGGTLTGRLILNEELHYTDTKRDWSDTSLDSWVSATVWSDTTGRRMHDLIGVTNGVWRKSCFINEQQYFSIQSDLQINFWGNNLKFNGHEIECIDSSGTNYIRYTNGLLIVFSIAPITFTESNTATTTITLPVAFKDGNYQVVITNSGGDANYVFDLSIITPTTTSFGILCKNSVSISATRNIRYIAIGFWK